MRNLKRVLSLVLATVMLLGMMVMSTSAKDISDFPDADQIDDYAREAVAITTGLGIFSGEAGTGNFNPNGTVDRAQLATIICKIRVLEGTVDYNLLKGSPNTFPDAKTYQGGWAEGYINYCQAMGIVRGYPNGTFGAGDEVITWHAVLALERAIGYYTDNEKNGEKLDETVVASKGLEIGLYGDMSLPVNHVLTRQELAVMVYNALFAQRVQYSADRKDYVKANNYNVVPNNSTIDPENTLAYGTFYLRAEDGVVMSNSATDPSLAGSDMVGASTMVDIYNKDHKLTGLPRSFEYETGTNLIGHAVTVYYSEAHKVKNVTIPEKVYAMIDQATLVDYITYATTNTGAQDYTSMNRAAVAKGFKSLSLGRDAEEYNINYDLDVMVKDTCFKTDGGSANNPIKKGDYILLISNEANKEISYAIVLKQYVDDIEISTNRYDEIITRVSAFNLDDLYLQDALENGNDVIVTPNYFDGNGNPKYAVVQAADVQPATVTQVSGISVSVDSYRTVTADGVKYTESPTNYDNLPKGYTRFQAINQLGETTLVKDLFGQLIAITQKSTKPSSELVYVSQFGYKYGEISSLKDKIVLTAEIWHADGTSEIIYVNTKGAPKNLDTTGSSPNWHIADGNYTSYKILDELAGGSVSTGSEIKIEINYTRLNAVGSEPHSDATITTGGGPTLSVGSSDVSADNGGDFLGVWKIEKLSDGTYSLKEPADTNAAAIGQGYTLGADKTALTTSTGTDAVRIVKGHSTYLRGNNNRDHATLSGWNDANNNTEALLQTNSTIYWYVDGNYGDSNFSVSASVGVGSQNNLTLYGLPGSNDGTWAEEAWVDIASYDKDGNVEDAAGGNHQIKAMVIHGAGAVDDLGVCYYNQGSWTIDNRNDEYVVTFQAYDTEGNMVYFPYTYRTYGEAVNASKGGEGLVNPADITLNAQGNLDSIPSGYYTFYSNKIVAISNDNLRAVVKGSNIGKEVLNGTEYAGTVYVADATTSGTQKVTTTQMKAIYNLFTPATPQGFIYTDAKVIDLKDGVYTTVDSLYSAMSGDDPVIKDVQVSYSYSRSNYNCAVLYVIDYNYVSNTPVTPDKPTEDKTYVEFQPDGTGDGNVIVHTDAAEALSDAQAVLMIKKALEDQGYTVQVAKTSGKAEWKFTYKMDGSEMGVYTYDNSTNAGSVANSISYMLDGVEALAGTSDTIAVADDTYVKYRAKGDTDWQYTKVDGNVTITEGMEIWTGYIKVTMATTETGVHVTDAYKVALLKNTGEAVDGTADVYVKATDFVSLDSSRGTSYKVNDGASDFYYTYDSRRSFKSFGSADVTITVGYVKVAAAPAAGTAVEDVTGKIAITSGVNDGYAEVGASVVYTLTADVGTKATEKVIVTATLPTGYTIDGTSPAASSDSITIAKDATTDGTKTITIKAGNTDIGTVTVTTVKDTTT